MSYYIYENWVAEKKAVIHKGSCGYCKEGNGCHANPLGNKNGQWSGPYSSFKIAQNKAIETGRPVKTHRCCC
ncbi:MAG: hypothetical protein M0Q46_06465 [Endomicrobiales bacterium]|nr:hypothetical protein [Endomicrobiales bacterium]